MAEDYPGSPYNYTLLNPVKLVDPDGRSVDDCTGCPDHAETGDVIEHQDYGTLTYNGNYWENSEGVNMLDEVVINAHYDHKGGETFSDAINNFDKGGGIALHGIGGNNMGVLKGGSPSASINYDEIPTLGGGMASSRFIRGLQAISKFIETLMPRGGNATTSTVKSFQVDRAKSKHTSNYYVNENAVFFVIPTLGGNAPKFHRQKIHNLRTRYDSKARADSSINARKQDSLKVWAEYQKMLDKYED